MNSSKEDLLKLQDENQIYFWQVEHLYSSIRISFLTNTIFSLIVMWLLWLQGVQEHVFLWLAVLWLILSARLFTYILYKRSVSDKNSLNIYCRAYMYQAVATGLLWGTSPWVFGDPAQPEISIFLGFVIGGLVSGAVGTLSVLSRVYIPYLFAMLVPMGSWFFLQDDPLHQSVALIAFISIFGFIVSSLSYKKILHNTFDMAIKLSKQKQEVEKSSNAKSEFLSNMSHELRTPLNAILGFTQLIQMNKDTNELNNQHAREVVNAGSYLLTLIDDLLEISTIEANKLDLKIEPLNLTSLMSECIGMIQATAMSDLNISIDFDKVSCEKCIILVDAVRIKQVLLNLLSNACKYNKENGSVNISCTAIDEDHVRVFVNDTGQGIALDKQLHVFDSYQRLGQENSSIKGTGLGLLISRQLVEKMGGQLGFESEENKGSSFWIDLPLDKNAS